MNAPRISIIVLNWNGKDDTIECIQSLFKINYSNFDIIIVDNGSTDNSVEIFKKEFTKKIHIIETKKNLGYAGGNNFGIKYAIENLKERCL